MSFNTTSFRPLAQSQWWLTSQFRSSVNGYDGNQKYYGNAGTVIYRSLGSKVNTFVTGVTRNSTGSPLGSCRVELYKTGNDMPIATLTSDGSGNFSFAQPGSGPFYIVAYLAGSPDVAGTTVNTLVAV